MSLPILAYDTETTGKCDFRQPSDHPSQPRIVQLGAILYDEDGKVRAEMNLLVKPDGWTIPAEATAIHGISTEMCEKYGLPIKTVIMLFIVLARRAKLTVAHNRSFDFKMVEGELLRLGFGKELEEFRAMAGYCTMQHMTNVCKLPGRYGNFKWPTLQEAYQHAFGETFEGGHDASIDVKACARVYHWIEAQGQAATEDMKEAA